MDDISGLKNQQASGQQAIQPMFATRNVMRAGRIHGGMVNDWAGECQWTVAKRFIVTVIVKRDASTPKCYTANAVSASSHLTANIATASCPL